jgi:hypothetical protein
VAQPVGQLIRNQQVVGSNPTGGSRQIKALFSCQLQKIGCGAYVVPRLKKLGSSEYQERLG